MKFLALKCALCDQELKVGGNEQKKLFVVCLTCSVWTPITELVERAKEVTIGNHLRGQDIQEKGLPKARRVRVRPKA